MDKKVKIKILCLVIILLVILCAFGLKVKLTSSENNSDKVYTIFEVKNIKCKKGEVITVEIELLNDSDFVAANFEYDYGIGNMEYVDYEEGSSLKKGAMTMVNNDDDNHKVLIGYVANPEEEGHVIKSGKIISLKFKVKDDITTNKIENTFSCTTLKQDDGTDIEYKINQGLIEVE